MELSKSFAIIGAGNGGQAFAAYLSLKGHSVKIYDVSQKTVDILQEKGGVLLEGNSDVVGFGKIMLASTDLKEVIHGSDIVMVVLPSIYHKDMAEKMAPYLEDGQYVLLNPVAGLGIVEVQNALKAKGCTAKIHLGCTSTLLFACRAVEVGRVAVSGQKESFSAAALPASENQIFADVFADIFPQFDFAYDAIRVTLDNLNALVHPGPTLLYTGRIESGIDFEYYRDFTPSQGKLVEAMDKERMAIADAFGIPVRTALEEYCTMYPTHGNNVYEAIHNCPGYDGIMGQKTLRTRYILEDIPFALEAIKAMGQVAGVQTPCIDAVITLARAIVDDVAEGRTAKNLSIDGMSKEEFLKLCIG